MLAFVRTLPLWSRCVWFVLLLAVVGRVAFAKPTSATVVPIYLKAGERWLAGENIYAGAWPLDVYRNPPGVAAFFAPFTVLPEKVAGIAWRLLGVAVYITGLIALTRQQKAHGSLGTFAAVAAMLIIPSFNNGQVNVLLIGCLLHAATNVSRDRFWPAAFWIAFAAFFKVYPLAVGLLFCLVKPRLAVRLFAAVGVFALLPFVWQRPDYVTAMHREFVHFVELENQYRVVSVRLIWDWTLIPRQWLGIIVPLDAAKVVSVLAGLAFAGLVLVAKRRVVEPLSFALVLGCIWMTLFGPATENATYTLLAPCVAALFLMPANRPWLVGVFALFALPILRGLFPMSDVFPLRTAFPFGALALLAVQMLQLRRKPEPIRTIIISGRTTRVGVYDEDEMVKGNRAREMTEHKI